MACSSKSSFHTFFLPLLLGGDGRCRGRRLVDPLLSIVLWQVGYNGLESPELLTHLFRTLPSTAKISLLDFLYRDILEQIEGSRMFGDTSENYRETRDNSCVIILKSRLNPVGHSTARARFMTFSLIEDSRCTHAFSTTAPVRYITRMSQNRCNLLIWGWDKHNGGHLKYCYWVSQ